MRHTLHCLAWQQHVVTCCTECQAPLQPALLSCRGDGFQFDQLAFVGSQGRNEKAQNFARQFRQSQMYEVFINERLKLASQEYKTSDHFERKVCNITAKALAAGTRCFSGCCRVVYPTCLCNSVDLWGSCA